MRGRPALLVLLGLLAGLAAALQLGPVYWPGAGYILAVGTSLPVAFGAALSPRWSAWFFAVTAVLVGMAALEEMFIFLTTTGPLGLMLGLTVGRAAWKAVAATAAILAGGMLLMPMLAGVYPLGGVEATWSPVVSVAAYGLFALTYAALWRKLFLQIWARTGMAVRYTRVDQA